jgi:hypothetical protein
MRSIMIALSLGINGLSCDRAVDTQQTVPAAPTPTLAAQPETVEPVAAFEEIIPRFIARHRETLRHDIVTDSVRYDVRSTDSLITPYVADLNYRYWLDMERGGLTEVSVAVTFSYQREQWVKTSGRSEYVSRINGELFELPDRSPSWPE